MELGELFNYDLWANLEWVGYLPRLNNDQEAAQVSRHIVQASTLWLSRCEGESPAQPPEVMFDDPTLRDIHRRWVNIVAQRNLDEILHFRRLNGEQNSMALRVILPHVLNHGTYHRCELRGLCRARGLDDFPDTDLFLWALIRSKPSA